MSNKNKKTLGNTKNIELSELAENEYRSYQLYTLMDRAIPYLVDGLKPAQRRILYTLFKNMNQGNMKVTSATGLVLTLHPHGPASIETGIVNLTQKYVFSNNYPLIKGKGYFGERMEPTAAAGRYIECKLNDFTEFLLFDDLNQLNMIPNYDEKVMEPEFLLPKLPIMLLNGSEGIGTGYSVNIPSFHHKDIIDSMISYIKDGKTKKLKPFIDGYKKEIKYEKEKGRFAYNMMFERIDGAIYITELPKGFDAAKIYKHLNKFIEEDFLKDYVDSSSGNDIKIELVFKKGFNPKIETVIAKINQTTYCAPNYTLIGQGGIVIFDNPEAIIEIFTTQRLAVVKKRYELLAQDAEERVIKASEIIRFIKEQHYAVAEKKVNRSEYLSYLSSKKFKHAEYLADMPIYRMTKEEVIKRQNQVLDDGKLIKEYTKILKNKKEIENKLIEELTEINTLMNKALRDKA